tara:strand:- start:3083 stop:7462 length:4380 start_codon:yes stop_codon:yes gene_type:complete
MPFISESFSEGFGVPNQTIKQTISQSFDPFGGLDVNTNTFQNTRQGLLDSNQDGRVPLGLFSFDEENKFSRNFPDDVPDNLFRQLPIDNLITNGNGKLVRYDSYLNTFAQYGYFQPDGGWGYCTYDGVGFQEITASWVSQAEINNGELEELDDGTYDPAIPDGRWIDRRLGGSLPDNDFKRRFAQHTNPTTDENGYLGYAGYYPYVEQIQKSIKTAESSNDINFTGWDYSFWVGGAAGGYGIRRLSPEGRYVIDDGLAFSSFHPVINGVIDNPSNNPNDLILNSGEIITFPNVAKWIISDEAYSYNRCLDFTSMDFTTFKEYDSIDGIYSNPRTFSWSDPNLEAPGVGNLESRQWKDILPQNPFNVDGGYNPPDSQDFRQGGGTWNTIRDELLSYGPSGEVLLKNILTQAQRILTMSTDTYPPPHGPGGYSPFKTPPNTIDINSDDGGAYEEYYYDTTDILTILYGEAGTGFYGGFPNSPLLDGAPQLGKYMVPTGLIGIYDYEYSTSTFGTGSKDGVSHPYLYDNTDGTSLWVESWDDGLDLNQLKGERYYDPYTVFVDGLRDFLEFELDSAEVGKPISFSPSFFFNGNDGGGIDRTTYFINPSLTSERHHNLFFLNDGESDSMNLNRIKDVSGWPGINDVEDGLPGFIRLKRKPETTSTGTDEMTSDPPDNFPETLSSTALIRIPIAVPSDYNSTDGGVYDMNDPEFPQNLTDEKCLLNVEQLLAYFYPLLLKSLYDLGFRSLEEPILGEITTDEILSSELRDEANVLNNIAFNQYRTLNQVQRIYVGGNQPQEELLFPFTTIEVKFKMKTMDNELYQPNNPPQIEIGFVDSDGAIQDPRRDQDLLPTSNVKAEPNMEWGYGRTHYYYPHGDFNSQRYDGNLDNMSSQFGSVGRFQNNVLGEWQEFSYRFTVGEIFRYNDTKRVRRMHMIVQAANNFYGRVLMDDFKVYEVGDFEPDVDVRKKISTGNYGSGDLTEYYDKDLQPQQYKDTQAPLEAQFYFYPTYKTDELFDVKKTPIYQDFKKGAFYLYDVDWGDGSSKSYTSTPEKIDEEKAVYHTYETSGIFEVTGYMIRMKVNEDDEPMGISYTKRFSLTINVNEGDDEDFPYFGSDGFSFIPYKNTLPIIGGYSKQSIYYKTIERQLGFISNNVKTNVEFKNDGDKLKTELALLKMDASRENELDILPNYLTERTDENNSIINNGLNPLREELGQGIGDCDLTCIKYYNEPKSIWEIFGFNDRDSKTNLVTRNGEFINRRTGELVPDGTLYHIHPDNGPMEGAVHNPNIQGGTAGHDFFDNTVGLPMNDRYWKNIIPKDYSIFNREGVVVESDNKASYIDVYNSEQDFRNNFYYPVLPKYGLNGKFIETIDENENYIPNSVPNNKISWPLNGGVTIEDEQNLNLVLSINSEDVESNILRDFSGNSNLGFVMGDYKPRFDNKTLQPKKVKTMSKLQTSKTSGAF